MNVLFTCAGRRSYAIRAFQEVLNNCGRVFACDASLDASALQIAYKGFVVPPADADDYIDVPLTICREQRVCLLIPAVEPELPLLAAHRARFLKIGTLPLVSSPEIVAICYDKPETAAFLDRCGLAAPRTYVQLEAAQEALSRGEITFPLLVSRFVSGTPYAARALARRIAGKVRYRLEPVLMRPTTDSEVEAAQCFQER
jgi:carbamoyl-phosphate synthase large subunit